MHDDDVLDWERLLADHLAGRSGAASSLLRAATPVVTRAVRSQLTGPDVDDAVQEALLDVLRRAHTVRNPPAFPCWIHVVAMNAARRVRRQRSRSAPPVDVSALGRHAPAVAGDTDAVDARLDATGLFAALDTLTSRERDVVLLLDAEDGNSYVDVSERLGCPVGSIGPTRKRALGKLRRQSLVLVAAG